MIHQMAHLKLLYYRTIFSTCLVAARLQVIVEYPVQGDGVVAHLEPGPVEEQPDRAGSTLGQDEGQESGGGHGRAAQQDEQHVGGGGGRLLVLAMVISVPELQAAYSGIRKSPAD